ncbi:hypothetical protein LFX25_20455 [Leptospira sp. FAT2]|uniref:hypothetical protein n=1 Tax=Leptospira sanjuanensis TaxID=2879643 RepID=UPI001EE9487E|nr:hypothetical protein [Leptospira sanjuanensis]MCG6195618.1 hypothetical protein [Leptospira sanjuanensis]
MQSKSQSFGQTLPYFGLVRDKIPELEAIEESYPNFELDSIEGNFSVIDGEPLHGDKLMKALQSVGLTRPIRDIYHKLKRIPVSYSTVYFAFYKDTYNKRVFDYIESLGVKHNRQPKKKGRPSDRDRTKNHQI